MLVAMAAVADALAPLVESGEVPGLVAVLARGDDVDVTVLGDQAIGGPPMSEGAGSRVLDAFWAAAADHFGHGS